ncbi:hypothetical protein M433DRAFT_67717 [Acidomyces richmondensis BFW]|nr:hypothetical protein M433DRAFT_67717 [Acidomyces richmondensis BFW]
MADVSASEKASGADHVEGNPEHEAALASALALASLFSNCVEAFGLIHPSGKSEKEEQLLLVRLGLQQARLLIWGDIVGISSPPAAVTDRAVPKHPSAAYPDLKEPTFFGARDARLDDPPVRTAIEAALTALVDRSAAGSREEMMAKYGLKPPKRGRISYEPALDTTRLEAFRERFELLKEVAEDFAHLHTANRSNSIVQNSWAIAEPSRFASFIKLTQEKVDGLIDLMGVKERVDRAMRMDIRALGWHIAVDRARVAVDTSKLRLIQEACKDEYPEYTIATNQALEQISREARENIGGYNPYAAVSPATPKSPSKSDHFNGGDDRKRRPGIFKLFGSFGRSHDKVPKRGSIANLASGQEAIDQPERSRSESGPVRTDMDTDMTGLERIRSKSVGAILEQPAMSLEEQDIHSRLEKLNMQATEKAPQVYEAATNGDIIRHDQYHGIARTETRDLRQPGVNYN